MIHTINIPKLPIYGGKARAKATGPSLLPAGMCNAISNCPAKLDLKTEGSGLTKIPIKYLECHNSQLLFI